MVEYPTPQDLKPLQVFLGLTSYYRRFIPRYSPVAQSFYYLTCKDVPFEWTT